MVKDCRKDEEGKCKGKKREKKGKIDITFWKI
jgi:hypothetical protein